ncbi:hypothetical protein V1272_002058 [Bradyrhizobium sp. AZCC 1708]
MTLTHGRFISYEYDRMVVLFSMLDGNREIPCAVSTSAMDELDGVVRARGNSCGCASASRRAPPANIGRPSSRERRPELSCAASISESCDKTARLAAAHGDVLLSGLATALCARQHANERPLADPLEAVHRFPQPTRRFPRASD